ncbi:unnamed protein product [Tuber melanosporum]|uniref:(Perigord truffle) hypothetical protein n=1 Tax=Tuber melanosporum (strain Mel28) TaxID=656061 RepID=D5GE43_TUBMM|nr:uncharacterized protein GSTUM_00006371001 [Tuber melanosporum]CAZ82786.1 unnamed protein product [Tuber melanosporum]
MSPKPEPLDTSSSAVQREHHPISHSSIQSLPIPAASNSRFGASLPALQDPRYSATSSSGYESSSPTSAASSIAYSPFTSVFQPTSYPTSASSTTFPSYSMSSEPRPRIPSIHSPTSGMGPHHRSSSGSTKSVSPSLGSSARANYATSTPHLSHHLPSRGPQSESLPSPHSPLTPASRALDSPTITVSPTAGSNLASPLPGQHDPTSNGLGVNSAGPPLGETQLIHSLTSADGHLVRPEIHARVDKGFFLSERDWTCYRRNYFSVICSYSLQPTTYSLPLYLRRTAGGPTEHVLAFAMCISAVVDAPGGKVVDLVQHTPKRDKGPQHKPNRIKLSPQPTGGMAFAASSSSPVLQQQVHSPQAGSLDREYSFPQQTQQQQHIAVFDRIQFKSATANNGKRRAAQQYYHLIVELFADVGSPSSSAASVSGHPSNPQGSDGGWVKIAYRISAPMVVRGRSPGHYADERRTSASSPGAGGGSGNGNGTHPSPTSGGSGFMSPDGVTPASGLGGSSSSMGMTGLQLHTTGISSMHSSPATSSIHNPSVSSASSSSHLEPPIDPILDAETASQLNSNFVGYQYFPSTIYESTTQPPPQNLENNYETHSYSNDRKSEHPLETNCQQFDSDVSSYIPASISSNDSLRKTVKEEYSANWLGGGASVGREQRFNHTSLYPKCGRFEPAETSRGYYPDLSAL